jgi:hypothetical protein
MRRSIGVMVIAAALASGACAADGGSTGDRTTTTTTSSTAPPPVEGLTATVGTNRLYQPRRELGLALANHGDAPKVVTGVRLATELFEPTPLARREVVLQPGGRRLVLPLPYGAARCGGDPAARFEALLVLDDGRELAVPAPEEYDGAVERLHARECAAAEVLQAVEISFEGTWPREGNSVSGTLSMSQRSPGAEAVMEDVVGNVIFTVRARSDEPILRTGDGHRRDAVPVTITADRCDSHAVAEFKRPFVFLSWIRLGDGSAAPVELELDGRAREALEELLASC